MKELQTSVPFIWWNDPMANNTCSLELYSIDEISRLLIIQCFEYGVKQACARFGFSEESPQTTQLMNNYVRLLSSPIYQDAFAFMKINLNDKLLVDILHSAFEEKTALWTNAVLPYGTNCEYRLDEMSHILENNFAVKKVTIAGTDSNIEDGHSITSAYIHLLCGGTPPNLTNMLKAMTKQQSVGYWQVLLSLNTLPGKKKVSENFFYALLLKCFEYGDSFYDTLRKVRDIYEF